MGAQGGHPLQVQQQQPSSGFQGHNIAQQHMLPAVETLSSAIQEVDKSGSSPNDVKEWSSATFAKGNIPESAPPQNVIF